MAADQDRPDSATAGPGPESQVPAPSATPVAPSRGFAWLQAILAAVIGGVVALALVFVLASQGIAPNLKDPRAEAALQATESLQAGLDTLNADLTALKSAVANDEVGTRVANLAERLGSLEDRVAGLAGSLERLSAQIGSLTADAPDLQALSGRIDSLADRLDGLAAVAASAAGDREPAATEPADTAASDAIGTVVTALAAAAEAGDPFQAQLDLLAGFGIDAAVRQPLQPYANGGTPTRAALIAAYAEVEEAILAADRDARRNDGFFGRLFGSASDIVSVRPTEPIEGDSTMAIVSRMNAAIESGDLATALSERASLPSEPEAASADWADAVTARLALDAAVSELAAAVEAPADAG